MYFKWPECSQKQSFAGVLWKAYSEKFGSLDTWVGIGTCFNFFQSNDSIEHIQTTNSEFSKWLSKFKKGVTFSPLAV